MSETIRERIASIIAADEVVLFMKGTKTMPRCGFSASVVQVLDELGASYSTVDVLEDPEIREGIKQFSNWPTIPQLYVRGEFQGGADIVREMYSKGELHTVLGVEVPEPVVPTLEVSPSALEALTGAKEDAEYPTLRLEIDPSFRHNLYFDAKRPNDVEVTVGDITLVVDPASSRRADGLKLDFVSGPGGTGFKIDNPNAPPTVKSISAQELQAKLAGEKIHLFDVRTPEERAQMAITPSVLLDEEGKRQLESLSKDTPLYFYCQSGQRSHSAASHYLKQGYREVYNLTGGIIAWRQVVS